MKAHDRDRVSALRMILSQLQLSRKEATGDFGEDQEFTVLNSEKKRRLQASEGFRAGGREESAIKEEAEAALIDTYLPAAMDEAELTGLIKDAIAGVGATGIQDMGKVMSKVMPEVAGRADGKAVSEIVKKQLAQ